MRRSFDRSFFDTALPAVDGDGSMMKIVGTLFGSSCGMSCGDTETEIEDETASRRRVVVADSDITAKRAHKRSGSITIKKRASGS